MRRRDFIKVVAGSASIWPFAVRAQQATTPLIGFLSSRSPNESEALVAAFRQGLAEAGYAEGQNVHLAFRWAEGRYDRLPELAAELVKAQVAVIASVGGSVSALAARSATRTIPIVAVTTDPVKYGLVASFNKPGGNIYGDRSIKYAVECEKVGAAAAASARRYRHRSIAESNISRQRNTVGRHQGGGSHDRSTNPCRERNQRARDRCGVHEPFSARDWRSGVGC